MICVLFTLGEAGRLTAAGASVRELGAPPPPPPATRPRPPPYPPPRPPLSASRPPRHLAQRPWPRSRDRAMVARSSV